MISLDYYYLDILNNYCNFYLSYFIPFLTFSTYTAKIKYYSNKLNLLIESFPCLLLPLCIQNLTIVL